MIRALVLLAALAPAFAAQAESVSQSDVLQGSFRTGWQTGSGSHIAALDLRLAPAWKTYWRAPGDAGIPPQFDWAGSENVGAVTFHWPAPSVFHTNGLQTVGYHDALVLPFEVTPKDPAKPVVLRAAVDLGVCKDICMPAVLQLDAVLSPPGAPDSIIKAALKARPATAREAGVKSLGCTIEPVSDGLRITARMDLGAQGADEAVVFEPGLPGVWVSESVVTRDGRMLQAISEMVAPSGQPFALDRSAVVVTVIGSDGRAVEIRGCPAG